MKWGGNIEDRVRVMTRSIGLVAPAFVAMYGYLVALGYAPSDHYWNDAWLVALATVWLLYGVWQYFWPPRSSYLPLATLTIYHVLGAFFILSVSGFATFVLMGWAVLALISYLYYSSYGYVISLAVLLASLLIDSVLYQNDTVANVTTLTNLIGVVLFSGAAAMVSFAYRHQSQSLRLANPHRTADHERLVTVINNLADAVFVTSASGTIELYNASALNLLDTNIDIIKKPIDDVFELHNQNGEPVNLHDQLVKARHVTIDDSLLSGNDDEQIRLSLTYAPIRSSYRSETAIGDEGYIVIARDVTKQKSLEEERDEFISVVSHELRTPVTVAEGTISNAKEYIKRGKDTKANISSALDEAHEQVLFLSGMINDLSTLSRAERGVASEVEVIDIASFSHDLYNEYTPEADKKGIHFNLELQPSLGEVSTSRLYLHELLQNFITNAIKYTKEGSVTLNVGKKGGHVRFSVSDSGIGISKADQAKIFNKFYRSEDYRTRETSGTGLGLYVAAKLAKKLHTKIDVKSRLNHGSTFSIELPSSDL